MKLPPQKTCERICLLHAQLGSSNSALDKLLALFTANQLTPNDLPEFFHLLGASSKKLPSDNICERIAKLHARIGATKNEWTTARKKLLHLLAKEKLSWGSDLPAILAAVWIKQNPQVQPGGAGTGPAPAAAPSADPTVDIFDLNAAVIADRVVMTDAQTVVVVLWTLNSFVFRNFEYAPLLGFIAGSSGYGKSRAQKVLKNLTANAWYSTRVTAASVIRLLRQEQHTCFLDEAENLGMLEDKKLRSFLDNAFERDGTDSFVEAGKTVTVSVFTPTSWAIRGEMRDVTASALSRSVIIEMQKAQPRTPYQHDDPDFLITHAENLKWSKSVKLDRNPSIPEQLSREPRLADVCRPLLSIADALGHGDEARKALIELCASRPAPDSAVQALIDCRAVRDAQQDDRISLKDLCYLLIEMFPERWADWRGAHDRGMPHALTKGELSRLAVVVGVGGTLACQTYRDEISQLFPPSGWLFPVSTTKASAPNEEQLKPVAIDLALVRRSMEQLASNQEQLARKQDGDGAEHTRIEPSVVCTI